MKNTDYAQFINSEVSSEIHRHGGAVEITRDPAVWTLAHRGYCGSGRLDVWVYPTQKDALYEGARLAVAAALEEEAPRVSELFEAGRYQEVLDFYEATHPETHLLRVQAAFLQHSTAPAAS
ncbi:hypothetical protein ACEZCY_35630 [Streptacidiphilus sp. N1-12]|uniref:Uncharacterized protein n=1 Tax=Streptacidiphilus alkalitolerans TaxID=3342712 RepID=A0ABV6WR59_9ACTN